MPSTVIFVSCRFWRAQSDTIKTWMQNSISSLQICNLFLFSSMFVGGRITIIMNIHAVQPRAESWACVWSCACKDWSVNMCCFGSLHFHLRIVKLLRSGHCSIRRVRQIHMHFHSVTLVAVPYRHHDKYRLPHDYWQNTFVSVDDYVTVLRRLWYLSTNPLEFVLTFSQRCVVQ